MRQALLRQALIPLLALTLTVPLGAAELAGVQLDDSVNVAETELILNGLGLRRKIVKVYVGGLYLPAKEDDAAKVFAADAPRRMVMHVVYKKLSTEQLVEAWNDCLEANTPQPSPEVRKAFDQLNGWMEEVLRGEAMVFTYLPGTGTEIVVRGASKGTLAGKDFADALFACWIGEKPATKGLKNGLLGN